MKPGGRRAFTLIEVMVAMVILGLVMSSLYATFRTGVKAYDIGSTHSQGEQMARFTIAQVTDDLRNLYYKKASQYNVTRRQREAMLAERERLSVQTGRRFAEQDEENMPELGPRIDLALRGNDAGDTDELTFIRLQTLERSEDRKLWGLARVRYFVAGNALYRSLDDVKAPEVDEDGNEIPKPYPPQVDKLANHVKGFDLKFGYYYDKEWKEAEDWDSESARYRNPPKEEEEQEPVTTTAAGGQTSQPLEVDAVPAWVKITFTFTDPKKEEKEKKYEQIIRLPQSQESYLPEDVNQDAARRRSSAWRRDR